MNKFNRGSVFLAYTEKDLSYAWNIYDGLTRRGLNVWFDKVDFKRGSWKVGAREAINLSRCLIVCLSDTALKEISDSTSDSQDKSIRTAYEIAQNMDRDDLALIPVMIEDCDYGNFYLSSLVRYDLFDDFEGELNKLSVDLGGRSLADPNEIDRKDKEEKKLYNLTCKAETAYYAGDYTKSITALKRVLNLKHGYYKAWNNKGTALCKTGNNADAIDAYDNALKIKPDYYEAWNNKGNALFKSDHHDAAMDA